MPSHHISPEAIESHIVFIREQRVMMDVDLAYIYGVSTRAFNQAVKRNIRRFPRDFIFRLTKKEMENWKSQIVTSNPGIKMGLRKLPLAFTEHGAIMAANILKSRRAELMSVYVVRAFIRIRTALNERAELARQLAELEKKLVGRLDVHEAAIVDVLHRVMRLLEPAEPLPDDPTPPIGFGL